MKLKRNVLICAVLLLAAFWLNMRWFYVHFTPDAAFRDYFLGLWGRTPTVLGTYDGDGTRFYFVQDNSMEKDGDFAAIYQVNRAGPFWRSFNAVTFNEASVPREGMEVHVFGSDSLYACAFCCDPNVEQILLRIEYSDGQPSHALPTLEPYGDLYFWYLPDTSLGQDLEHVLEDCMFVFTAYDAEGKLLQRLAY